MDYKQVCDTARSNIGPFCKACYVCNGVVCKNTIEETTEIVIKALENL